MPDCLVGESPQDYFSRVLAQCGIESATSSENNSGDSAPTPFNIGQIQSDVARNAADIDTLEGQVGELETQVNDVAARIASGHVTYDEGDTEVNVGFPSSGDWHASVTPTGVVPSDVVMSTNQSGFTITFAAAASTGGFSWTAIKAS